jgi:4-carboxymuconolactone decarboxylase
MKVFAMVVATVFLFGAAGVFARGGAGGANRGLERVSSGASGGRVEGTREIVVTRRGARVSTPGDAEHFTGTATIDRFLMEKAPSHMSGATVEFEAGARTAWHSHPLGQTLIVTAGKGWVQQWGHAAQEMREGDVVWIPAAVKHWHGAAAGTGVTHIGIQESVNGKSVEWMEKVSDEQYRSVQTTADHGDTGAAENGGEVSAAQRLMGDFDPKLAELTDNVLYRDVWERPGLSKRDRSLITAAALIALDRPDQLRSHLRRARDNGVTKEEVVEMITHLAFYAGWPNAVSAVTIARDVYR